MKYFNFDTKEEISLEQARSGKVFDRKDDSIYFINVKSLSEIRLNELINWFDNYFDKQLTQSQWQKNFKVSEDPYFKDEKGQPRNYADIEELKAQAEIVRNEIRELRK